MLWLIFRREHQRDLKMRSKVRGRQHLLQRKILDAHHLHRPRRIAQPRTRQFIRSRPRRKHVRHWIARLKKALSIFMQHNVVAIRKIVLQRKSIRRIPEPPHHKRNRNYCDRDRPIPHSPAQSRHRHNNHQRNRGQHIARQHCPSDQRHRNYVHFYDDKKNHLHGNRDALPLDAITFIPQRWPQHGQQHPQRQHPQMQIDEDLPQPQRESQNKSQRIQRSRNVIAKKLRIPEDISGPRIVITKPERERQKRNHQRQNATQPCRRIFANISIPELTHQPLRRDETQAFPRRQPHRRQNRRFLSQRRQREPHRRRKRTILQISAQSPEREPRRRQIQLCQRTLRKKNGIQRCAQRRRNRDLRLRHALSQPKYSRQRKRRNHQHRRPRHQRRVAHAFPPQRNPGQHQWRMRVRNSGVWNQAPAQQQVARSRNVVPSFVPEIRKLQQRNVQQKNSNKNNRENHAWMRSRRSHGRNHFIVRNVP